MHTCVTTQPSLTSEETCKPVNLWHVCQRYLLNLKEITFVSFGLSAQWGLSLCEGQSTTME